MLLALGVAVALSAAWGLRALDADARRRGLALARAQPAPPPDEFARVLDAVRSLQLVTVELHTVVSAQASHESWRGPVRARVEAPARLLYATDLSGLRADALGFSPVARAYAVRVPAPTRLAAEVQTDEESIAVQLGWGRFRSRAGEYYLGLARKALTERARAMPLSPADEAFVRRTTREQVADLVRAIVGPGVSVRVTLDDEPPTAPTADPTPVPPEPAP